MDWGTAVGLLFLYGVGIIGWRLAKKIGVPNPAIIGSILLIGLLRVTGMPLVNVPSFFNQVLQIILGIFVGSRFSKKTLQSLHSIAVPAIFISVWAIGISIFSGFIVSRLTFIDFPTAILASSVGGLADMTVLALSMDVDVVLVVIFHIFRLLVTLLVFPLLIKWIAKDQSEGERLVMTLPETEPEEQGNLILTIGIGAFGGILGILIGIPAGGLVGTILFLILASIVGVFLYRPSQNTISWIIIGLGVMVTNQVSSDTFAFLLSGKVILPILLSLGITFLSSFLIALLISKVVRWPFILSFLSAAPAGFFVMASIALQMGNNPLHVTILHLCRLLVLKLGIPFYFMLFLT